VSSSAFSQERQEILEDFVNLEPPCDTEKIGEAWSRHYSALQDSRGIFVVTDSIQEKNVPGNQDFDGSGFLRCWMSSSRVLLIQNRDSAREFRYSSPIFCDTNFASFCEAFEAGRSLGAHQAGFEAAVKFLLPLSQGMNIFPYLIENAGNPNRDKVHATIRAFAAFKLTSSESFAAKNRFTHEGSPYSSEQIADGCLETMGGSDFKVLHAWMKRYYFWARIVLLKSTLVVFKHKGLTLERRYYSLIKFLHEEMARLPQFETFVGYRFFALSSGEPFFQGVQQNARALNRTLSSMAWDLAHWRALFDMLLINSIVANLPAFPIPHFLTFDEPFVRLTEGLRLDGLIYDPVRRRTEQIPSGAIARSVSKLLRSACEEFVGPEAREDRARRALEGE
jgi:hypothetical protein